MSASATSTGSEATSYPAFYHKYTSEQNKTKLEETFPFYFRYHGYVPESNTSDEKGMELAKRLKEELSKTINPEVKLANDAVHALELITNNINNVVVELAEGLVIEAETKLQNFLTRAKTALQEAITKQKGEAKNAVNDLMHNATEMLGKLAANKKTIEKKKDTLREKEEAKKAAANSTDPASGPTAPSIPTPPGSSSPPGSPSAAASSANPAGGAVTPPSDAVTPPSDAVTPPSDAVTPPSPDPAGGPAAPIPAKSDSTEAEESDLTSGQFKYIPSIQAADKQYLIGKVDDMLEKLKTQTDNKKWNIVEDKEKPNLWTENVIKNWLLQAKIQWMTVSEFRKEVEIAHFFTDYADDDRKSFFTTKKQAKGLGGDKAMVNSTIMCTLNVEKNTFYDSENSNTIEKYIFVLQSIAKLRQDEQDEREASTFLFQALQIMHENFPKIKYIITQPFSPKESLTEGKSRIALFTKKLSEPKGWGFQEIQNHVAEETPAAEMTTGSKKKIKKVSKKVSKNGPKKKIKKVSKKVSKNGPKKGSKKGSKKTTSASPDNSDTTVDTNPSPSAVKPDTGSTSRKASNAVIELSHVFMNKSGELQKIHKTEVQGVSNIQLNKSEIKQIQNAKNGMDVSQGYAKYVKDQSTFMQEVYATVQLSSETHPYFTKVKGVDMKNQILVTKKNLQSVKYRLFPEGNGDDLYSKNKGKLKTCIENCRALVGKLATQAGNDQSFAWMDSRFENIMFADEENSNIRFIDAGPSHLVACKGVEKEKVKHFNEFFFFFYLYMDLLALKDLCEEEGCPKDAKFFEGQMVEIAEKIQELKPKQEDVVEVGNLIAKFAKSKNSLTNDPFQILKEYSHLKTTRKKKFATYIKELFEKIPATNKIGK